jgi:2-hydroxycyclohexanecarboxyl-CoA dehydrogenase
MRGLTGKRVIVTGGASGIGRAVVNRFIEEGCMVAIFDLNGEQAQRVASEASASTGGKGYAYTVDISDYHSVQAAVYDFEETCGPTDTLINNAGWDRPVNFIDSTPDFWRKVIDINLYGPLNVSHVVMKGMAERGSGRVVNVASDAGRVGSSGEAVYSACKGGLIALTKTLARELARKGIMVNTVCPGPTDTPLLSAFAGDSDAGAKIYEGLKRSIPMGRLAIPSDFPGVVAFLASDDCTFIQGQTISVSGGLSMHG